MTISEVLLPVHGGKYPVGVEDYRVRVECVARSEEELNLRHREAAELIKDLIVVWPYAFWHPYHRLPIGFRIGPDIDGWSTNAEEVRQEFRAEKPGPRISGTTFEAIEFTNLPEWPLKILVQAVASFRGMDPLHRALVGVHSKALQTDFGDTRLFLFAKANEIVELLLPGERRREKAAQLPNAIQSKLRLGFEKLFELANQRFNVRHPVTKTGGVHRLNPTISHDEVVGFLHDSDCVIRHVIAQATGIPALNFIDTSESFAREQNERRGLKVREVRTTNEGNSGAASSASAS